jgi:probable rRNA maturation factor
MYKRSSHFLLFNHAQIKMTDAGQPIIPKAPKPTNRLMGEVFLCLPVIEEQSIKLQESVDQRLAALVAHSFCHCLGYTHDTEEDYAIMRAKEEELLQHLGQDESVKFSVNYFEDVD